MHDELETAATRTHSYSVSQKIGTAASLPVHRRVTAAGDAPSRVGLRQLQAVWTDLPLCTHFAAISGRHRYKVCFPGIFAYPGVPQRRVPSIFVLPPSLLSASYCICTLQVWHKGAS